MANVAAANPFAQQVEDLGTMRFAHRRYLTIFYHETAVHANQYLLMPVATLLNLLQG